MSQKRNKSSIVIDKKEKEMIQKIGEHVRELRMKVESNYEKFAFTHDINRSSLYRLESGDDNFTINTLLKVLRALDISPVEFFKGIK